MTDEALIDAGCGPCLGWHRSVPPGREATTAMFRPYQSRASTPATFDGRTPTKPELQDRQIDLGAISCVSRSSCGAHRWHPLSRVSAGSTLPSLLPRREGGKRPRERDLPQLAPSAAAAYCAGLVVGRTLWLPPGDDVVAALSLMRKRASWTQSNAWSGWGPSGALPEVLPVRARRPLPGPCLVWRAR
jgi:hypothetical protein